MVHWIPIHFLIHYLLFKNFAVCCSFSITRALNTAETAWMKFVFSCLFTALYSRWKSELTGIYYINTNEIPGELSRENLISSHVKISPLLWLHNKSRLSHQKTIKVKWFGISFTCIIYRRYYMAARRYEISLLVLKKYFTRSLRSLVKYFSTLEEKFRVSARPCNILYLFRYIVYEFRYLDPLPFSLA